MAKVVVVDSDAIFALYNPNDPLNKKAVETFGQLIIQGYQFIYPSSIIFEVISLFQRVLPTPTVTVHLIEMIKNNQLPVYIVDDQILKDSTDLFDPFGSKKNTLIDCSVVAVAKRIQAKGVFSYDSFYTKQGLIPAEKLL